MADAQPKGIGSATQTPPTLAATLAATVARFHGIGWLREAARLAGDAPEMARLDVELDRLSRAIDARTPAV